MKKIAEGAEAAIYSWKMYGVGVIVKYRAPKRYRVAELDTAIRKGRKIAKRLIETLGLCQSPNLVSSPFLNFG